MRGAIIIERTGCYGVVVGELHEEIVGFRWVVGELGQFGWRACRKFPEFLRTVAFAQTPLLRPGILQPAVPRVRHAVEILDQMSSFMM